MGVQVIRPGRFAAGFQTITQQQKASNVATADNVAATFGATPTVGNILIGVGRGGGSGGVHANHSISGSGWAKIVGQNRATTGGGSIWWKVAGAAEPTVVTFTSTGATSIDFAIYEYSGLAASPVDQSTPTDGGGTNITTVDLADITTTQTHELVIAAVCATNGALGATVSWSDSFVEETAVARMHVAARLVTATGTFGPTHVWTTIRTVVGVVVSFKAASA